MSHLTLLVATPGGHIEELLELAPRIDEIGSERLWVTARTPQTSRILASEETRWVSPVASRQGWRALSSLPTGLALVRRVRPKLVVSTGAALAVPYLVAARACGVRTHYVESATRLDGPSVTGRMMARLPGVKLHHQSFRNQLSGWHNLGSIFDTYEPGPATVAPIRRAVITLGTERYAFPRALRDVASVLPHGVQALIQTGHTQPLSKERPSRPWIPADELLSAIGAADVVITHAGVGSVLSALRAGKHPIVIPRLAALNEHVDDHQLELAQMLANRGLATVVSPDDDLSLSLAQAARRTTVRANNNSISLDSH